jgi:hypothetical protein
LFFKFKTEQAFSQCFFGIYKAKKKIVIEKKMGEKEKKIVKKELKIGCLQKL